MSGFFGIFVGDSLLFATLTRLGPRRTGILYALNAPIAALIAWLALGETLAPQTLAGVAVTVAGVILAILFGKRRGQLHPWESVRGPLWLGVALGLGAATGQALGSIVARPVMAAGADPFAASLVRVVVAAICLSVLVRLPIAAVRPRAPADAAARPMDGARRLPRARGRDDAAALRARRRQGRDRRDAVGDLAGDHPADDLGADRRAAGGWGVGRRGAGRRRAWR